MSIKGQGHSLTLIKGHSDFNVKTSFSQKQLGDLEPKFIWKLEGEKKWKFIQMSWVTWPTWLPCPYMVKTLKKSSSPEPRNRWPWNLVCSIVYESTTKVVQIMTLGWPLPILRQGQIWSDRLLYGKKWKLFFFFGNYCSLGSQSCLKHLSKWVNEVEWESKVKVILWFWSKVTQISKLNLFSSKTVGQFWTKIHMKAWGRISNENLYKRVGSHDQHGCHAHI